jgi:trimeric autotransporter adhesin
VTIRGDRFVRLAAVQFGSGASAIPTVIAPGKMTVVVPTGASTGLLTITGAAGSSQSAIQFVVTP